MTARVRKGLPFVCRLVVEKVILGILARAQGLYPVEICAYVFMGNHYHLILTGHSKHISPFMNYIQGNIAQSVQRFIPNCYNGFIWESRFKEQILLTVEDVIDKMAYIYLNPVRARLTIRASQYPGISSYNHLLKDKNNFLYKWIPVSSLKSLPMRYNKKDDLQMTKDLLKPSKYEVLRIEPFAWIKCFREELNQKNVKDRLIDYVSQEEKKQKTPVVGVLALKNQNLRMMHQPKEKKPTPYLICSDKELRISEINSYKYFCDLCSKAWELIKIGIRAMWPKGAYFPAFYRGWAICT